MSRHTPMRRNLTKTLLVMKLTFLLLTVAFMNVQAHTAAQSVTFSGKNISLQKVFKAIKKQTGYVVFTSTNVLADTKPISLSVSNMPLADFLNIVLKDQPLNYQIEDKTILLSRKPMVNIPDGLPVPVVPPPVEVKGKITNRNGSGISRVSIAVKGTQQGTITDDNGNFSLKVADENASLIISFTGYKKQEVKLNGRTEINVQMEVEVNSLNDVVVVGYGTQSRSTVSGAISKVSAKDVSLSPAPNLGAGLAG
ncbi:MAG: carboxypeptidase-like regulatory domain-containing protein, partial [Ferruginibacter sp.]